MSTAPAPSDETPRAPLRAVLDDFRPFARDAARALGGIALGVGAAVTTPLVVAYAIDHGVVARSTAVIGACVVVAALLAVAQVAGSFIELANMGRFAERFLAQLRARLLDHLHALDLDYFSTEPAGKIVSRLTSDVESLQQFLQTGLSLVVRGALTLLLTIAVMAYLSWQLTLAVLVIVPVLVGASRWYRPRAYSVQMGYRESMANLLNHVNESLVGMRVVQAYSIEHRQRAAFSGVNDDTYHAKRRSGTITATYYSVIEFLHPAALAIVVGYGAVLVDRGTLQVGVVIAFTLYLTRLFEPIQQLIELTSLVQQAGAAFSRAFAFLGRDPAVVDAAAAVEFARGVGDVRLEHVSLRYAPTAPPALDRVDLHVAGGERIALVGTSGAGKSTLAKLVGRFYDPTDGRVMIDGQDVRGVRSSSLRRHVVVVPQEGFLFDGTIADNIALARPGASRREIEEACERLGFAPMLHAIPGGLDARVANRGLTLSSGQRQLVALTRALVADPSVIVLDEATSNLDPHTDALVERALATLLRGRTAIVIAHRVPTARRADRVVVLAHGRIAEDGAPAQLLAAGGDFARWVESAEAATRLSAEW